MLPLSRLEGQGPQAHNSQSLIFSDLSLALDNLLVLNLKCMFSPYAEADYFQ